MKHIITEDSAQQLPFADVSPGGHHVVVDLDNLVRVVVGVQGQQFVGERVGLVHLILPLLHVFQKDLRRKKGSQEGRKRRKSGRKLTQSLKTWSLALHH